MGAQRSRRVERVEWRTFMMIWTLLVIYYGGREYGVWSSQFEVSRNKNNKNLGLSTRSKIRTTRIDCV